MIPTVTSALLMFLYIKPVFQSGLQCIENAMQVVKRHSRFLYSSIISYLHVKCTRVKSPHFKIPSSVGKPAKTFPVFLLTPHSQTEHRKSIWCHQLFICCLFLFGFTDPHKNALAFCFAVVSGPQRPFVNSCVIKWRHSAYLWSRT